MFEQKENITVIRGGLSFGDRKIKCPQSPVWWVTYLMLRDKYIELKHFNGDIMSDTIEESRLDYKDTKYRKAELYNSKIFPHDK